ncbi:PDZ domain-containing protein [Actinocorallia longicatena]|uniref:endopeptidase La n=1 Tax=Actinocorallia longicatena TaxID=111803 RepID=A0ABP6Q1U3_9ACTN
MVTEIPTSSNPENPENPEGKTGRLPHRRALTLSVTSVLILVLALIASIMHVPYVSLRPGPTMNTLGVGEDKKPLITITGHPTFPDDGHLNFTTVAYTGGPQNPLDLFGALRDWFNPDRAVVPQETIFPKNETVEQVEQENVAQMVDSQQTAVAAALTQLNRKNGEKTELKTVAAVASVQPGLPSDGKLKPNDVIVSVNGVKIVEAGDVVKTLASKKPGDKATVVIERDGKEQTFDLTMAQGKDGRAVIGITPGVKYVFPFEVKISVGDIGGPSAGLMFSLGIYDLLTPGSLTGGRFIAGTGTIDVAGKVGPIGGIPQKMIAAKKAGAVMFLVPPGNCAEALGAAPKGLRLVKAETLDSAVTSLEKGAAATDLPRCTAE